MSDSLSRNHVTEMQKKLLALDDGDIVGVFSYICNSRCRNDKNCRNNVSNGKSIQECMGLVRDFRNYLWSPSVNSSCSIDDPDDASKKLSRRDYRNVQLIDTLFSMRNPATW